MKKLFIVTILFSLSTQTVKLQSIEMLVIQFRQERIDFPEGTVIYGFINELADKDLTPEEMVKEFKNHCNQTMPSDVPLSTKVSFTRLFLKILISKNGTQEELVKILTPGWIDKNW